MAVLKEPNSTVACVGSWLSEKTWFPQVTGTEGVIDTAQDSSAEAAKSESAEMKSGTTSENEPETVSPSNS
jgi:hypothetical protein